MNAKEKAELEQLRKMAQENSERNHQKDSTEQMAALVAFTWVLVFILTLVVFLNISGEEPTWLYLAIPTLVSIGIAWMFQSGSRTLREIKRQELGWDSDDIAQ